MSSREERDMSQPFRVGITCDLIKHVGTPGSDTIGLSLLSAVAGVQWEFLAEESQELRADQVRDYDALLVLGPHVTAAMLEGVDRLAIVARFGVGYDRVDVDACTRN